MTSTSGNDKTIDIKINYETADFVTHCNRDARKASFGQNKMMIMQGSRYSQKKGGKQSKPF